jgi:glutamate-ammonia-ligase adenylyltransferase
MTQGSNPALAAEQAWTDWRQAAAEVGLDWFPKPALEAELLRVWEASDYVRQSCRRDPPLLAELAAGDLHRAYAPGDLRGRLTAALEGAGDQPELARVLRRFRRREMVRVIWRDLAELAPLAETLEDLSELADACVGATLERVYAWGCAEMGTPRDPAGEPQPLVVLGMGKLGARELNLSSDIDLIFAFPRHGNTDGRRQLSNEQFFTRVCQRLVKVLDAQDSDGFVFRVDTRLRPFGSAGPLAMCFDAMEDYYQSQAREWERYAMIKARVVAGDKAAGEELQAMLRPFVYRRYLDFGAIESLRRMKSLISQELQRKGMADNIKLGPGGIREIEFIGQAFQLIRGGREPDLQVRPILRVLERLGAKDYLPSHAVRELSEAYVFLRRLENRLQAWADRQTHLLPPEPEARLRLARSMGFADWDQLKPVLERHRRRVQGHFDAVFAAPQAEEAGPATPVTDLWRSSGDGERALAALRGAGFQDPEAALERISAFRASRACRSLSSRGRERLEQLMPLLLEAVSALELPDLPLERLLNLLEAVVQRTAYVALMVENPIVLSQLVRLTAISPWIAALLTRYPLLLDELLDPRRLYSPLHRRELEAEAESLLCDLAPEDLEQQMERLRQFAQSNRLRVAAADITGAIPLMVVSDFLTEIAEVVLARVLEQAWMHLKGRHGRPAGTQGDPGGFAVIGYGKLGGIELGYGSDLDLVFLHGGTAGGSSDGPRPLSNEVFYARLGQRIIHMLGAQTPSGVLYETDMRLRPNGASGLLVSSLEAYRSYQLEEAWTWEHQALIRARAVAGDPQIAARFAEIRNEVLARPRDPDKLRQDVCEMRERMRAELQRGGSDQFDLKQGAGGIADIEFMVQYAVLRWAHEYPDLLEFSDNIRLLDGLERHRLLAAEEAGSLRDAYRAFRASYHRNALQELPGLVAGRRHADERARVRELWQRLMHAPAG